MAGTTDTFPYVQALAAVLNDYPRTVRWNFPQAVGSSIDAPSGIGQAVSLSYTFVQATPSYYRANAEEYNQFRAFSAAQSTATRQILDQFSAVAKLTFAPSATGIGQIAFGSHEMSATEGGIAYFPSFEVVYETDNMITSTNELPGGGDVWLTRNLADADMQPGRQGYSILLHEIGHALGLQHPFEGAFKLPADLDTIGHTVMSYTNPGKTATRSDNTAVTDVSGNSSSYRWVNYHIEPRSPMPLDILALQYLYGANTGTRAGNDSYAWQPDERFLETIWDGGGTDTIDCSNQSLACAIDLNPGAYSSIGIRATEAQLRQEMPAYATQALTPTYDGRNNLAIAYDVTIENAVGGSGADTITGNAINNRLDGGAGNDTLNGGTGIDTAIYAWSKSGYTATKTGTGAATSYALSRATDGIDTLTGIEKLQFADGTVYLMGEMAKLLSAAQLKSLLELYVAFFNRVPDAQGLGYWIEQAAAGMSSNTMADSFYNAAIQYSSLTGYSASMTSAEFVRTLYANVLGRSGATAPPDDDVNYWVGTLAAGSKGKLVSDMLVAAKGLVNDPTWGWVSKLLDNKDAVAEYNAITVAKTYATPEQAIAETKHVAELVTYDNTSKAIELIGVASSSTTLTADTQALA